MTKTEIRRWLKQVAAKAKRVHRAIEREAVKKEELARQWDSEAQRMDCLDWLQDGIELALEQLDRTVNTGGRQRYKKLPTGKESLPASTNSHE